MPFEQSCSIEYGLEHASPMYEHQLMSRPCSQNSRMSVELVPNNFNPSPAYRVQHSHMSMSQPKQNCLDTYNGTSLSNNIGGSVGSHSRAPSASSPEDFTDIFSPLKYVQRPVAFRRITEKNSIWHFLFFVCVCVCLLSIGTSWVKWAARKVWAPIAWTKLWSVRLYRSFHISNSSRPTRPNSLLSALLPTHTNQMIWWTSMKQTNKVLLITALEKIPFQGFE